MKQAARLGDDHTKRGDCRGSLGYGKTIDEQPPRTAII
jgi:hypothetical protein